MANLKVNLYGMEFLNPIMTAAGPGAKDGALCQEAAKGGAGAICTKLYPYYQLMYQDHVWQN